MARGPFITFEGGEGAGKSTQIEILAQHLRSLGIQVECVREPGGTPGAEEIRSIILKGKTTRWDAVTEALLMSAARRDLLTKKILPLLETGVWVLCDRHYDSTTAYQGFGHGLGYDRISELNHFTVGDFAPDLTFIFDLPPEIGLARTHGRSGGEDRYERMALDFHTRVHEGFKEILMRHPERCVGVDALLDIESLSHVLAGITRERLAPFFQSYQEVSC